MLLTYVWHSNRRRKDDLLLKEAAFICDPKDSRCVGCLRREVLDYFLTGAPRAPYSADEHFIFHVELKFCVCNQMCIPCKADAC